MKIIVDISAEEFERIDYLDVVRLRNYIKNGVVVSSEDNKDDKQVMTDKEMIYRGCKLAILELMGKNSTSFYTTDKNGEHHIMYWGDLLEKLKELCEVKE